MRHRDKSNKMCIILMFTCVFSYAAAEGAPCEPEWLPSPMGNPGLNGTVDTLAVFDDGSGAALFAGGNLVSTSGVRFLVKWEGGEWVSVGGSVNNSVHDLVVYDDGSGPALYVGGRFTEAGGVEAQSIARWDGDAWSAVGLGMNGIVNSLHIDSSGSQSLLYAGGSFTVAGGQVVNRIAVWDGTSWGALGQGMDGPVRALTTFDDGTGEQVFAGGAFTIAGDVEARSLARWDGNAWTAVGVDLQRGGGVSGLVNSLDVIGVAQGQQILYVGGSFATANQSIVNYIAQWNGGEWESVSRGVSDGVNSIRVLSGGDGNGQRLFVGGRFSHADALSVNGAAQWTGSGWTAMGEGITSEINQRINDFVTYEDPDENGMAVYAGGRFTEMGGVTARSIAKWGCPDSGVIFFDNFVAASK